MSEHEATAHAAIEFRLGWGPVLRGVRWGTGTNRVILLHEPGTDLDAWGSLPRHLASMLAVEVLNCDLPGHGLSDDPWDAERLPDLIRDLISVRPAREAVVIAAQQTALAALEAASALQLAGVIGLSPGGGTVPMPRSPLVPKQIFAGARSGRDLESARQLAARAGGWAVVTSVPVAARGTDLLRSAWAPRVAETCVAFIRDCLGPARQLDRPLATATGEGSRARGVS